MVSSQILFSFICKTIRHVPEASSGKFADKKLTLQNFHSATKIKFPTEISNIAFQSLFVRFQNGQTYGWYWLSNVIFIIGDGGMIPSPKPQALLF